MSRDRLFAAQFLAIGMFFLFFPGISLSDSIGHDLDLDASLSVPDSTNSMSLSSAVDPSHEFTDRVRVGSTDNSLDDSHRNGTDFVRVTHTPVTLFLTKKHEKDSDDPTVPEPATFSLMAVGLGALILCRTNWSNRRNRKSAGRQIPAANGV
jgi:PEP-CTERM motif